MNKRLIKSNDAGPPPLPPITDSFNIYNYTGNGGTQTFNIGFRPDFIWFKAKSFEWFSVLYDSIRGANRAIISNSPSADFGTTDGLASFNDNGFTISGGGWITNRPGYTYIAWCWKAGEGVNLTNTNGTIESTVSANPGAGFSIVKWTSLGSNTDSQTVGHGLYSTPDVVIIKNLSTSTNWRVYHSQIPSPNNTLSLNTDEIAFNYFPSVSLTNFGLANSSITGEAAGAGGQNIIAYAFSSIPGFSKMGYYDGNGTTQNIYTTDDGTAGGANPFTPAYVMFKRTDNTGQWTIIDKTRGNGSNWIYANLPNPNNATVSRTSIITNGFALNGLASSCNESGSTYIYMAFANQF